VRGLGVANWDLQLGQLWRKHTHIKRFYRAVQRPAEVQFARLRAIIEANENTAFGKAHNFASVKTYQDFKRRVPACGYEDLEPYIERLKRGEGNQLTAEEPFMFATTSGTTARPKFVPITEEHLRDYTHAFQVHNYHMIADHPAAAVGKFLIISSNDEDGRIGGRPHGAVSGLLNKRQSPIIRRHFALPFELCKVKNVESKYYLLLRAALTQDVTAILGCNPSSFLLLADQMKLFQDKLLRDIADGTMDGELAADSGIDAERVFAPYLKPDKARAAALGRLLSEHGELKPMHVWPNLALMSMWKGGPMSFYLEKLSQHYGPLPVRDFGYMASEGRGTIPLGDQGAAGVLAVSCHFFEFVAEDDIDSPNPRFYTADELRLGGRYFIHFTTAAGLYRYNINDLMEVESMFFNTPTLRFVRKGAGISSVTGEKITEEQVLAALKCAQQAVGGLGSGLEHFTAEVKMEVPPYYLCYGECERSTLQLDQAGIARFLSCFDQSLMSQNPEYAEKRLSRRLGEPRLELLPAGTYARLRQQRVQQGAPEAQVKMPLLSCQGNFSGQLAAMQLAAP
jgi:GH3 auxin-responsive promoter